MENLLILIIILSPIFAKIKLNNLKNSLRKEKTKKDVTAQEVAKKILEKNNLEKVYVVETKEPVSDHYDASRKVIRFTSKVFNDSSITSISISAYISANAILDTKNIQAFKIKSLFFQIFKITDKVSYPLIVLGALLRMDDVMYLGILFLIFSVLFNLCMITLEKKAIALAKEELSKINLLTKKEIEVTKNTLDQLIIENFANPVTELINLTKIIVKEKE